LASEVRKLNTGMLSENLLSLSYGEIVKKDIAASDGLLPASFETYNMVRRGDIVLRLTDLQNDQRSLRSGLVREDGIITAAYTTIRPEGVEPRFMAYEMQAIDLTKTFYSLGGGLRQSLGFDDIKTLVLVLPPIDEQRHIADYLDHETAEIDAFIAEQVRFVSLLEERSEAVLAGSFAGRRDDVVEVPIGRLLQKLERSPQPGAGVVTAFRDGHVGGRWTRRVEGFTEASSHGSYQGVVAGDLVFHGLDGFAGAVGVARDSGICSPVYHVCRANVDLDLEYVALLLRALGRSGFLEAHAWSVRQRAVDYRNWRTFRQLRLGLPPREVQSAAVRAYRSHQANVDLATADARAAISLAKERRAALITAAVTGQIDVTARRKPVVDSIQRSLAEVR
jgi:type I restriction enzyme S subunit